MTDVQPTVEWTEQVATVEVNEDVVEVTITDDAQLEAIEVGVPGPPGPVGTTGGTGPTGPQGPPGDGSSANYTHNQGVAASTWTIAHGLGFYPNVAVTDSAGTVVEGAVQYLDINTVQVAFSAPFGGSAHLS